MSGNVPIVFPPTPILDDWQPRAHLIASVSNSTRAIVQTVDDHGYLDGMTVTIIVPKAYGMAIYQNTVISTLNTTSNTFLTDIDTSSQPPFVAPSFPTRFTEAQAVPVDGPFRNVAQSGL